MLDPGGEDVSVPDGELEAFRRGRDSRNGKRSRSRGRRRCSVFSECRGAARGTDCESRWFSEWQAAIQHERAGSLALAAGSHLRVDEDELKKRFDEWLRTQVPSGVEAHVTHFAKLDDPARTWPRMRRVGCSGNCDIEAPAACRPRFLRIPRIRDLSRNRIASCR